MKIKPIQEAPPNKTTTKALLKGADEEGTYLEITENIDDVKDLYFAIQKHLTDMDKVAAEHYEGCNLSAGPVILGPISCCYNTKKGYIMIVTTGCVIKWLGEIYTEGEILGIIKDREMI